MRIVGVAMVRNEADIVEAFVRHNLTQVDALTVVDHGSTDGTSEILAALVAEGLPLALERDASLAQRGARGRAAPRARVRARASAHRPLT